MAAGFRTGRSAPSRTCRLLSRPICRLALRLNDEASDEERQQLLPFVTRLACADTAEVERQREIYISSFYDLDGTRFIRHDLPFRRGLEILESALAMGRQADALAPEEADERLGDLQQRATSSTSGADHPMLSKIKSWLMPAP